MTTKQKEDRPKLDTKQTFKAYDVEIRFLDSVAGGTPAHNLLESTIKAIQTEIPNFAKQYKEEMGELDEAGAEEFIRRTVNVFFRNGNDVPCLQGYQVKGMLKTARKVARYDGRGYALTIQNGCIVLPRIIPLKGNLGVRIYSGRVDGQGHPRSIIAAWEFLTNVEPVNFRILIANNSLYHPSMVKQLVELGSIEGLGAQRQVGHGQFEILSFTESN